jgi:hypothetical protein
VKNTKKQSFGIDGVVHKNNCIGFSYRKKQKKEEYFRGEEKEILFKEIEKGVSLVKKEETKNHTEKKNFQGLRIGPDTNIEDFFINQTERISQKEDEKKKGNTSIVRSKQEREEFFSEKASSLERVLENAGDLKKETTFSKQVSYPTPKRAPQRKSKKFISNKDFLSELLGDGQYEIKRKSDTSSFEDKHFLDSQREISFNTPTFKFPSSVPEKERIFNVSKDKEIPQNKPSFSGSFFEREYRKTLPKIKKKKSLLFTFKKKFSSFSKKIVSKSASDKKAIPKKKPFSFYDFKENLALSLKNSFSHFSFFSITATFLFLFFSISFFIFRGISLQGHVLGVSSQGMGDVFTAIEEMKSLKFVDSKESFDNAAKRFEYIATDFDAWAGLLKNSSKSLPLFSKISSGSSALEAATELSLAGKQMSMAVEAIVAIGNPFEIEDMSDMTLLEILRTFSDHIVLAKDHISKAYKNIENIRLENLPEEKKEAFLLVKTSLPEAEKLMGQYVENIEIFEDILGANGPRKYLFLLQNPHEIRATGGFIGSYGLLSMKNGHIQDFFIDGIFNPDGQLTVDVVPPEPIRKISSGWSLHDSNWFADFPSSAKKAMHFYEKGKGPTVDGVIAITPELLKYFLRITGPIYLEEYDISVDEKNYMESLQYQVEEGYDREENAPKKILNDLAPLLVKRVFENSKDIQASEILEILYQALAEKQILLYSRNDQIQKLYSSAGWAGEVLETEYNYLNVVHSNINGFKTDRVIDEMIKHSSQIHPDGSIVDTVTIRREHLGGDTPYDWYNQVNADYMRLYVPKGAELLSVSGHTREKVRDPLDYDSLGFLRDADLQKIDETLRVHEETGTQVFEESGKTVFGNWVYVSPKESVTVTYVYKLPFSFDMHNTKNPHIFSLLSQKQAGLKERQYSYSITYPDEWKVIWKTSRLEEKGEYELFQSGNWNKDIFLGLVFESL